MHLLAYTSKCNVAEGQVDEELAAIREAARRNNPELEITGVLFYDNGRFLQVLEGEKDALDNLMNKVAGDARHSKIDYLINESIPFRQFSQWNMVTCLASRSPFRGWCRVP